MPPAAENPISKDQIARTIGLSKTESESLLAVRDAVATVSKAPKRRWATTRPTTASSRGSTSACRGRATAELPPTLVRRRHHRKTPRTQSWRTITKIVHAEMMMMSPKAQDP